MSKKILNIVAACFLCLTVYSQNTIEGTVYEKINGRNEPAMGVNVVIANEQNRTLIGMTTSIEGKYALRVPENQGKLKIVFTFIGMKPQSFDYTGQKVQNAVMEENISSLKEVTVAAKRTSQSELGITEREQTFSSQKIKMDAIVADMPVVSVEEALQGKISGLDILAGGDPGSRSSIRIRGTATLNSKTDPLIVINGVPYSTSIDDNFDFNTANNEDFAAMLNLNPNDIESIEVLKDAASTSIYGTAGANGVLLITTKKGTQSKTTFSISSKNSIKFEPTPMPMLTGNQYVAFIQDAIWNTANARGVAKSGDLLELLFDTPEINYRPDWRYFNEYNANTDWLSYIRKNAFTTDNSFSMSGGGEKATYRFSLSYVNEGGTTLGTGLQRLTSSFNVGYFFSDKLRVEADFSYSGTDKEDNWTTNVRAEAFKKMPNKSPFWMTTDENGNVVPTENYFLRQNSEEFQGAFTGSANFHPLIMANESYNNNNQDEERMIVRLKYDFLPGFSYQGYVSMRFLTIKNRKYLPLSATGVSVDNSYGGLSADAYSNNLSLQTENKLLYRTDWDENKHSLAATAIWRTAQSTSSNYSSEIYGAAAAGMSDPSAGGSLKGIGSGDSEGRTLSGITSLNYTLLNRYVLSGTVNYEGKSSLGKDKRWGMFPSLGAAWHVTDESFMKNVKFIDEAKIRASYGQSGQAPGGTAPYVGTYTAVGRYNTSYGIAPQSMQLDKLKWESSTEYDFGVDLSLFNNKLTMTFDWYYKYTKDLLQNGIKIPSSAGFENSGSKIPYFNSGEVSNTGWEYRFDWNVFQNKDWYFAANFNIARNINTIEVLPDNLTPVSYSLKNGEYAQKIATGTPTGSFFGYKYLGVYQNTEDTYAKDESGNIMYNLDNEPIITKNGTFVCYPGDAKYSDENHDGVINEKDIVYIGNCMPQVHGGGGVNVKYKNLSLTVNMHYRLGQKIINQARMNSESMYGSDNQSKAVLRRWRNEGDDTQIPRALWKYGLNYLGSDRFVEDCSYLRMQSVSLNYRFPKSICSSLNINTLSMFLTVYDLWTWTKYTGQDPEVNLPSKVLDLAVDNAQTPRSLRFSLGLNINF
ncbi:MAG: SusC/RagA family TonB-linked outer membrane protein [Paludibacter sp.]|jgi:TonB-linked SusC/RagA family outer membrane protein|nr:SusC/RagA family TonB-linked outer membrane protein [Paludibacter sp.]